MSISTEFASPESGAINNSSLPETGLANELSRVTRKKSCREQFPGACAKTAAAVQVNASSANPLQQRKGLLLSLNRERNLSRPCMHTETAKGWMLSHRAPYHTTVS